MCAQYLEASPQVPPPQAKVEILKVEEEPSLDEEQAPTVEVESLSSSLVYEFPGPIMNASLNASQIDSSLRVLREH